MGEDSKCVWRIVLKDSGCDRPSECETWSLGLGVCGFTLGLKSETRGVGVVRSCLLSVHVVGGF